uniref:SEC7 domain-containing protein n=3 Tax=Macrostomum lignano TaxID=282301 RepID=A0A1I8HI94_9PLAT
FQEGPDTSGWLPEQVNELELLKQRKRTLEIELTELRTELESLDREIREMDIGSGGGGGEAFEATSQRDKALLTGRNKFNLKPATGIAYLVEQGLLENTPAAVASFLFQSTNLSRRAVGDYFAHSKPFNVQTLDAFAGLFNFAGKKLMQALREFLGTFAVAGESQVIERCISVFAKSFASQNPDFPLSADRIFVLCYACMILNTALHNENAKKDKTTRIGSPEDFQAMLERADLRDLDRAFVRDIYEDIRLQPFVNNGGDSFEDLLHSVCNVIKEGYLYKQGGKVRTWKRRYCMLHGGQLSYLADKSSNYPKGIIQLRDLGVREAPDKAKSFCFELFSHRDERIEAYKTDSSNSVVAGRHSVYKFSAQSLDDLQSWVRALTDSIQEQRFFTVKRSLSYQPQPVPQ